MPKTHPTQPPEHPDHPFKGIATMCSVCGENRQLASDGTFEPHSPDHAGNLPGVCAGSARTPSEASSYRAGWIAAALAGPQ